MARLLIISPTPTHPRDAGNRARIFSLLAALKAAGHQIYFAFVKMETGDEEAMAITWDGFYTIPCDRPRDRLFKRIADDCSRRVGSKFLLPYGIDDWYAPGISLELEKIRRQVKPDAVIVEYAFLSRAFECFGRDTLKILDTHDIFGDRHRMYLQNGMMQQWFYTSIPGEKKALDRADLILAIQKNEAAYYAGLTERQIITVGHVIPSLGENMNETGKAGRLLFVGSGNPINIDALKWFIQNVFPVIRQRDTGIELEVAGDAASAFPSHEGIIPTGPVPDLTPHYCSATAVINPVQFGTGLKIKTLEALAMHKPLITTSAGALGLEEWKDQAFLSADDPLEFGGCILRVLSSPELRNALSRKCAEFSVINNATAIRPLLDILRRFSPGASTASFHGSMSKTFRNENIPRRLKG